MGRIVHSRIFHDCLVLVYIVGLLLACKVGFQQRLIQTGKPDHRRQHHLALVDEKCAIFPIRWHWCLLGLSPVSSRSVRDVEDARKKRCACFVAMDI